MQKGEMLGRLEKALEPLFEEHKLTQEQRLIITDDLLSACHERIRVLKMVNYADIAVRIVEEGPMYLRREE